MSKTGFAPLTLEAVLSPHKATAYCEGCQETFEAQLEADEYGPVVTCPRCGTTYPVAALTYWLGDENVTVPVVDGPGIVAKVTWFRWVCVECGAVNPAREATPQVKCASCRAVLEVGEIKPLSPDDLERASMKVRVGLLPPQNKEEKDHDNHSDT